MSPDRTDVEPLGIESHRTDELPRVVDRSLAERDDGHAAVHAHGLGDDIDRVGVVDDQRPRSNLLQIGNDLLHDADRAQRHEESAWPLCLLADHPIFERDALVQVARGEAAGPVAGQHEVAICQTSATIGRRRYGQVEPVTLRHALREPLHKIETFLIEIDQHDLGPGKILTLLDQGGHGARTPGTPAADIRNLQPCQCCSLLLGGCRVGQGSLLNLVSPRRPRIETCQPH